MNTFFLEYRDPLVSVIIFFVIIFIITFFSYWWGRYKQKEDFKHLNRFLKQFRSLPSQDELKTFIKNDSMSHKIWLLLANSYYKSGDYEKSIEIYNEMLHKDNVTDVKEIMFLLGKTYFKAGFLQRSKQIFLEILKNNPRTPKVLHSLLLVYEYMREYDLALQTLEPLDALDEDISLELNYLQAIIIINDIKMDEKIKLEKLLQIYNKNQQLARMIFEYIFRIDKKFGWKNLDISKVDILVDIFWNLDLKDLNLDIISQSNYLKELYSAKGYLNLAKNSDIFEFDILIKLGKDKNVTLSFEYGCQCCKGTYPFAFNRCSVCHSIDSMFVDISLSRDYTKDYSEENNSFQ